MRKSSSISRYAILFLLPVSLLLRGDGCGGGGSGSTQIDLCLDATEAYCDKSDDLNCGPISYNDCVDLSEAACRLTFPNDCEVPANLRSEIENNIAQMATQTDCAGAEAIDDQLNTNMNSLGDINCS